ncbi:uncharacterized protein LOC124134890 [Haliotis rufescens]|uniref:uncharacterized protein LOC124134890 n=1 Tax=Haliotis rufescens TaxID=6454 RepID=UPI00201F8989|nr:uncharacterized protein LOC124134890 [Haliotis rufescens]
MNFLVEANMAAYSGPGSTHQVLGKSFVWLFACYLLFGCTATWNITDEGKHIYLNNEELNWWAARANCQEKYDDLFVLVTGPDPYLEDETYYWLGAMRYSTWRWTGDGSPLYRSQGFSFLTENLQANSSSSGTSVYRCHRHCGKDTQIFGLSRDRCYCLGDDHNVTSSNTQGEPCSGNQDEVCGDANRMSVYNLDLPFTPTKNGKCAYAKWTNDRLTVSLDNGDECEEKDRRYACYRNSTSFFSRWLHFNCNNRMCISKRGQSWTKANESCNLVKLESSTEEYLKSRMPRNEKCWLGLLYGSTKKWITGQEANVPDMDFSFTSSSEPHCLAVYFTESYGDLSWEPCSSHHASICEVVRSKGSATTVTSTPPDTSTPATTTNITKAETETPTPQPTTANVPISERYTSTSTNSPAVGPTQTITASEEKQIGVFVGLGLGCVVLILAAIIVVLLLMRQNKLCFKRKDRDQPVHFNTVTRNATYDQLDVPAQTDNLYTVIVPSDTIGDKPVSPTVPMATVRPRVQTENTSRVNNEDDGDYNVITHQGMTPRKVDDSYSHIGRTNKVFEEDAYDVASTRQAEDRRDDTYNHTATVNENAGDTTDCYNTRSLDGDNNVGLGRQGDTPENTDVYSVAKGISNA